MKAKNTETVKLSTFFCKKKKKSKEKTEIKLVMANSTKDCGHPSLKLTDTCELIYVYKHTASHHSNLLQSHNVKAKTCHNSFRRIRMIHARDPTWFPEIPTSFFHYITG